MRYVAGQQQPTVWYARIILPFRTHCWVCAFYRGAGVGFLLGAAVAALIAWVWR